MKKIVCLQYSLSVFVLGVLLLGARAFAAEAESSAADQLAERLQNAETLQGNFTQRLYDQDDNLLQESQGQFAIQRPGSFHWETLPPYEQTVVSNANTLWVYDPDLAQVTVRRQNQNEQASPAELLSGSLRDLSAHYDVSHSGEGEQTQFTLVPLDQEAMFAHLVLTYSGKDLTGLEFEDSLGQRTALSFSEVQLNPPLDAERFQFDVPEGVDVIVDE